jgi:hypothetical protein
MIDIMMASDAYLRAKATTQLRIAVYQEQWMGPTVRATNKILRGYINSDPYLHAVAAQYPNIMATLNEDGDQNAANY